MTLRPKIEVRTADTEAREFHLREEMATPRVSLTGGRVSVWVYRERAAIREVVISGHAEPHTCAAVSARLFETLKKSSRSASWMISAGLGHVHFQGTPTDGDLQALAEMIDGTPTSPGIRGISDITGLVDIYDRDWDALTRFRRTVDAHRLSGRPELMFPKALPSDSIADYLPLIPKNDRNGKPFSFRLAGWDYDCPEYENVADRHLRGLGRALVADALRLRQTYRTWLSTWIEDLIYSLHELPQAEAERVRIQVPAERGFDRESASPAPQGLGDFLSGEVVRFAGDSAIWPRVLARVNHRLYAPLPDSVLNAPLPLTTLTVVDFPRGTQRTRPARPNDEQRTRRSDATQNLPGLISECLAHIDRMNLVIRPYERIAARRINEDKSDPLDRISRQMLIDTMVRGWPSFYLECEEDRAMFRAWSQKCRDHVWSIMGKNATRAGLNPRIFLEDCVAYDVQFDADLGCIITPRMLFESKYYALAQRTQAGATISLPIWPRRGKSRLSNPTQASNRDMALGLFADARAQVDRGSPSFRIASLLREALAWHPVVAANLILEEWLLRLGNWAEREYRQAELVLSAVELLRRGHTTAAREKCLAYIDLEPHPIPDVLVTLALAEAFESTLTGVRYAGIEKQRSALLERLIREERPSDGGSWVANIELAQLERELRRLDRERRSAPEVRQMIEHALTCPDSLTEHQRWLARAGAEARTELASILEGSRDPILRPSSAMRPHLAYDAIVRSRALLSYSLLLSSVIPDIRRTERISTNLRLLHDIADSVWVTPDARSIIETVRDEFFKGGIDVLLSESLKAGLREASSILLSSAEQSLAEWPAGIPPLESVVMPIHVKFTFYHAYAAGFDDMLETFVPLGRAISGNWRVLASDVTEIPPKAELNFEEATGVVSIVAPESSLQLLRVVGITDEERKHLVDVFRGSSIVEHARGRSQFAAESVLAAPIVPRPSWQRWRDAIGQLREELILVLSQFPGSAVLEKDCTPSFTESGLKAIKMLDEISPLDTPTIDNDWRNNEELLSLLGEEALNCQTRTFAAM
jgi:hypothetical protein